ncbi:MAG TPA: FAD-binding oxidoreductase [Ktedonobacteraceae bacterium]|nr:FAD-binding oxidoreductase [Ktedonobacteraceae bacterium]
MKISTTLRVLALVIVFLGIKKIYYLASDPTSEKDFFPDIHHKRRPLNEAPAQLPFSQLGGTINDVTGINRTPVYGIVQIKSEDDLRNALLFARQQKLPVSIAGAKHSMGGQEFATDALVLDMRGFNQMSVDVTNKILTVQSGAIWHNIQEYLNPYKLSIEAMQSVDVPTVGGTISVNAHGQDHRIGGIATTILSLRLMLADGTIQTVSRQENVELFQAAVGGYGLFGIILDVQLTLMDNLAYTERRPLIQTQDFPSTYTGIANNPDCHMFYARLSTAPSSFLKEMIVYSYAVVDQPVSTEPLKPENLVQLTRFVFNLGRKSYIGREIKWWAEKYIQPLTETFPQSRNQIMHRSYAYLKNNLRNNSDVLQEYFLPEEQILPFIQGLGDILQKHGVVTRNAEIRSVHKENILLDYARGDWFGVVLYLNFAVNEQEMRKVKEVHSDLMDLAHSLGGSFYLPYQLSATKEQIEKSYPEFDTFLALKKKYDPDLLFTSTFYETYGTR